MNFGYIIDRLPITVVTLMLLSVPFFVYDFLQADKACTQAGGVLVKSAGGWICIRAEAKQ
jgi:hypothetical protein